MFGKNTFQFNFIVRVLTKREKKKKQGMEHLTSIENNGSLSVNCRNYLKNEEASTA